MRVHRNLVVSEFISFMWYSRGSVRFVLCFDSALFGRRMRRVQGGCVILGLIRATVFLSGLEASFVYVFEKEPRNLHCIVSAMELTMLVHLVTVDIKFSKLCCSVR